MKRVICATISILLLSCHRNVHDSTVDQARQKCYTFHRFLVNDVPDSAVSLFSKDFYDNVDTLAFINMLKNLDSTRGKILNIDFDEEEKGSSVTLNGIENSITLRYKLHYQSNYIAKEEILFYVKNGAIGNIDYLSIH